MCAVWELGYLLACAPATSPAQCPRSNTPWPPQLGRCLPQFNVYLQQTGCAGCPPLPFSSRTTTVPLTGLAQGTKVRPAGTSSVPVLFCLLSSRQISCLLGCSSPSYLVC